MKIFFLWDRVICVPVGAMARSFTPRPQVLKFCEYSLALSATRRRSLLLLDPSTAADLGGCFLVTEILIRSISTPMQ